MMSAPTEPSTPTTEKTSLVEDLFDIWFTPSAVFARRRDGALGPFLVCALLLCALYFAAAGTLQPVFDAQLAKAITEAQAANPDLTGDQLAAMQGFMEKSIQYGGLIFLPIVLLLVGTGVWLAAKVLGGALSFGGGIMVAAFAYLPKALELLLVTVQGLVFDTSTWNGQYQFSWGVARFMDHTGAQGLYLLMGRVDVFTIWVTILIALGLIHTAKVERTKAYLGAAALWVIGAVPALMQLIGGK